MRVLITGVTGLLGWSLDKASPDEAELFGIYYPERELPLKLRSKALSIDITNYNQMQLVFSQVMPDVVVHTAAIGSVDFAEQNKEKTKAVNVFGTQMVIDLCSAVNARIMYISSNAVFDGNNPPYSETARLNPINYYGKLKVEAERLIQSSSLKWTIVRPILMYGWNYPGERDNPVTWWIRSLRENKPIKVVNNVYSNPLYSLSCARTIWSIINQNKLGIFHVAGADHLSLYDFAIIAAEEFGLDRNLIIPVPDSYFPEIAPRPRDTSFSTQKMKFELGLMPLSLRDGLRDMKESENQFCKL